jgi:hypothetical protein
MYGARAEIKPKMQDGRAKKCTMVEQKLNQKCKVGQKKCTMAEQKLNHKMQGGRAKKCTVAEQKLNQKCKVVGQNKCTVVEQKINQKCKMVGHQAGQICPMVEQKLILPTGATQVKVVCVALLLVVGAAAENRLVTISNIKPRLSTSGEIINAHDARRHHPLDRRQVVLPRS